MFRILLVGIPLMLASGVRAADEAAPAPAANLHDRIITQYMQGKWEEVEKELIVNLKEISAMPAAPRADVEYIRRAMAECKPPWWKLCKAGKPVRFKPVVWKTTLAINFDPAISDSWQFNYVNGVMSVVTGWKPTDMDNPAVEGKLGFSRGENTELYIWSIMGNSEPWSGMSPHFQMKLNAEQKQQFNRYATFRGGVAGMYYGSPRARRLAVWNAINGFTGEFARSPDVMTRKVLACFYAAEVLGHPETYPSVKRPEEPPVDGAEAKIVPEMQEWIGHNDLTFAEDKALREAVKSFAAANSSEAKFRPTGRLILPNGLAVSLDPAADKALAPQRDAWLKARCAKSVR